MAAALSARASIASICVCQRSHNVTFAVMYVHLPSRELGAIFCAAEDAGGNSSSQHAKQQMQAAYQAVMARQMAGQEAADMQ
jgi:hypothetical protein